jgi:hypothetical protein
VKKYKENLNNRDDLYEQVKNERIEKAKREVNAKKEILKEQNEMNVPENNDEENSKNIEQLRNIVDDSDKLYYDNLKKNSSEGNSSEEVPVNDQVSSSEEVEVSPSEEAQESSEEVEVSPSEEVPVNDQPALSEETTSTNEEVVSSEETLNNFKVDSMESLESDDPWLSRKNN